MKKKNCICPLLLAGLFLAAGCKDHQELEVKSVLYAVCTDMSSRVDIQKEGTALWTAGDRFRAFSANGQQATYVLRGNENTRRGEFVSSTLVDGQPTYAFYPLESESGQTPFLSDHQVTFTAPQEYQADAHVFDTPMLGTVQGDEVSFRRLFGYIKFDLAGIPEVYDKVEVETDRPVSGRFSFALTGSGAHLQPLESGPEYHTVTLHRKAYKSVFYVPLPPATYQFLRVYVVDKAGTRHKKIEQHQVLIPENGTYLANSGASSADFIPLTSRVKVQEEVARPEAVIDHRWAAVGIGRPYALQQDYTRLLDGRPSYRFELRGAEDNSLSGYGGKDKGRVELCYCYATPSDFQSYSPEFYRQRQQLKTVYHYGKGYCNQADRMKYSFSFYLPAELSSEAHTIFAQWHGMPKRNLVYDPQQGERMLTDEEFLALDETMVFKGDKGYDKITQQPNGWIIEEGGYPPLVFGITHGYVYIQANSDKKWMSNKGERCNINPANASAGEVNRTEYKSSTLAYKLPLSQFPRNQWVTFQIEAKWSRYVPGQNAMQSPGELYVTMQYTDGGQSVSQQIVRMPSIEMGRNDDDGYYFKYGIYRTDGSTVPLVYNLAGYTEEKLP